MKKLLLSWMGFAVMSAAMAQVSAGRTATTTLYEEFKPGVVTLKSGRTSKQSQLNIFLKNSTLVFKQGKTVMEANMPDIKRVVLEGKTYINYKDHLYEVLLSDSVSEAALLCQRTIDIDAWHTEALNNSVVDNLEYSANSRALNVTRSEDLVNKDYPVIDTYFFLLHGKLINADDRSVRGVLNRKKREQMDVILYYDFHWSRPDCLAKLMVLFK